MPESFSDSEIPGRQACDCCRRPYRDHDIMWHGADRREQMVTVGRCCRERIVTVQGVGIKGVMPATH